MNTPLPNSKGAAPGDFRRFPPKVHGVAHRGASEVAFRLIFGAKNDGKIDEELHFFSTLFEHAFRVAKTSSFGGARTSKTQVLYNKLMIFEKSA